MTMKEPVTAIMIGAGDRGKDIYGRYAVGNPDDLRFLAVAEPNPSRQEAFARQHRISPEHCYPGWEPLLGQPRLADAAFICTQDRMHTGPALAALEKGYHVLLEKPMAPTVEECKQLVETANQRGRHLQIGHVFRYSPFFQAIHQAIHSGELGELICLSQRENVSYYHMAHSFVRGSWRNSTLSNPMILAKCCHDMDLLYWLVGARAQKISSFGSLSHFKPGNAPEGVPQRCTDGCPIEDQCIYSAIDIYVRLTPLMRVAQMSDNRTLKLISTLFERYRQPMERLAQIIPPLRQYTEYSGWPVRVVSDDYTREGRWRAIQDPENPYGRCVYHGDNDVVDHQHVNIEFENGATATLIMHGHSYAEGRTLRIDGTAATLLGEMYAHRERLVLHDKRTGRKRLLFSARLNLDNVEHGGGDAGLMRAFTGLLRGDQTAAVMTGANSALESHLMALAAEQSRIESKVISMELYR